MKTQLNLTPGNWQAEVLAGLINAYNEASPGWIAGRTVTVERQGQAPVEVAGIGRNITNEDTKVDLYVANTYNDRIVLLSTDLVYLNSVNE